MRQGLLQRYHDLLPITSNTPLITLGEGNTPLVRSQRVGPELGLEQLYFKLEGCNPTGSFKDRGMVLTVARALEHHSRTILCASTGNTSASAAAYGAHCGLTTVVLVPKGNVAQGKLAQAIAHGANIFSINGNFDQTLELARAISQSLEITLVNSVNPYRLEGQKTASFEISDDLGNAPHILCIPVGNAGNITAYWKGFQEYSKAGVTTRLPQMWGFQAEGAAPIVEGRPIDDPKTIASAIRIGNPANWKMALAARDESSGFIGVVSDQEILAAYQSLAQREGIFCEPASAASVAGLVRQIKEGADVRRDSLIVCVLTGTGLKDPDLAFEIAGTPPLDLEADLVTVEQAVASASA
jgi:threonine synthase